ncbi:MAG: CarD family transcriptional regulator, partial [Candidatus Dojkabacteria bacterium]|nr:CarD family transcriptional regulator [Candidatus Dojkabacteria bacterium]
KAIVYSTHVNTNIRRYFENFITIGNISFTSLKQILEEKSFQRVEKVSSPGFYAVRGDTVTFWSSVYKHPIRASFWGEELEQIISVDEIYNTKIETLREFIISDESCLEDDIERQSIGIVNTSDKISPNIVSFDTKLSTSDKNRYDFGFTYPPLFFNKFGIFAKHVKSLTGWIVSISTIHKDLLPNDFKHLIIDYKFKSGFCSSKLKVAVFTDRELFGTLYISQEKAKSQQKINKYLAQLEGEVEIGNYIVHEDYGIAVYKGFEQRKVMGKLLDYLILEYAQKDCLAVPLSQIHKLTKYIGPDSRPPKITRLGKTNWNTIKNKVRKKVRILAKDLLRHYAESELAESDIYGEHEWEEKFSHEFEFEETEDQMSAINDILNDLASPKPMNRILVGDVGFGKTEVAIRGAFRTVLNGRQVAVLCPTTILVSQHYSVFKHRFRNYPINIKALSRFGSKAENEKIAKDLSSGKIDIVIGTHRLLSNDIHFNNLGLLVIDEEQRFGVAQKEKIKRLAYQCNVLSMSATPIPRTLSMALSSLRDISIITTPPPGRKSVKTKADLLDWNKVAIAIQDEYERNGQVYFLHNEVRTIETVKSKLVSILPNVRFKVAHGQMHPSTLEKVMREFYEHKYDCLICTTIIENGIDIPNVNTIIINKAQNFGLSQLYQLRGRVGRSNRQAFCFLFYSVKNLLADSPQLKEFATEGKILPFEKARARLEAILGSQEIGSGFKVASRDLEIRGAGSLLGRDQHGNISTIGLGLYTQLLSDEVERIRLSSQKNPFRN